MFDSTLYFVKVCCMQAGSVPACNLLAMHGENKD